MSPLECPCCGECFLDERLLPALALLVRYARPHTVEIVSGYRCAKQNGGQRGISKRAHREGRAVDLRIAGLSLDEMFAIAEIVPDFRRGGIGMNDDGTLHVDLRVYPARWARVNGKYVDFERRHEVQKDFYIPTDYEITEAMQWWEKLPEWIKGQYSIWTILAMYAEHILKRDRRHRHEDSVVI